MRGKAYTGNKEIKNRRSSKAVRLAGKISAAVLLSVSLLFSNAGTCLAANSGTGNDIQEEGSIGEKTAGKETIGEDTVKEDTVKEDTAIAVEIASPKDLEELAQKCRDDWYSYGKVFTLTADIDLKGTDFQGIPYFNGTLKGNGHKISGFVLSRKGSDFGFFRYLGKNARIEDLTVEGYIRMEGSGENIGGLAGVNFGTLSGCRFRGDVSASKSVGGIVGYNKADGKILDCSAAGTVAGTNGTGGICGENKGIIKDCNNESTINGEDLKTTLNLDGVDLGELNLTQNVVTRNDSGGIAGISSGTITGCTNKGNVGYPHVGYNVGGIAGRQSGTIMDCNNEGNILGRKDAGGIAGQAEPYMESEYLSDRLEKLQDDLGNMNRLVVQMSDALSRTSSDAGEYTKALQKQYEDTIDSLNREVSSLQKSLSDDKQQTKNYLNDISDALDNIGSLGSETMQRMVDGMRRDMNSAMDAVNGTVNDVKDKIENIKPDDIPHIGDKDNGKDGETAPEDTEKGGNDGGSGNSSGENGSGNSSGENGGKESGEIQSGETQSGGTQGGTDEDNNDNTGSGSDAGENTGSDNAESGSGTAESGSKDAGGSSSDESDSARVDRVGKRNRAAGNMAVRDGRAVTCAAVIGAEGENGGNGSSTGNDTGSTDNSGGTDSGASDGAGKLPDIDKDDIKDGLEDAKGRLDQEKEKISMPEPDPEIKENLNKMKDELSSISGNMKNMQNTISDSGDSVSDAAGNISNELTDQSKLSGDTIDSLTDSIDGGIQSLTNSMKGLMNTQQHITDSVSSDLNILMGNGDSLLDVSSGKVTEKTLGVIYGCTNSGSVEADINPGGIAGTMNVEYDFDPELDLDLSKLTDVAVRSTTNDVVIHCVNYGEIKAKKNNCGGIAGSGELGLIYDCENYGNISAESGKKLGGIAGISTSSVSKSYTFCKVTGVDYLGGICGDGFNISGCSAMCTLETDEGEYVGSISGHVDEEAEIASNYFVSQEWGGIDNINYYGKAESCTYEEIMQIEGIPQGFTKVTVAFENDGEICRTMTIPYGGAIQEEDVPRIPTQDGYLKWEKEFPLRNVTENMILKAEKQRWTLSLASAEESEKGKPLFLLEGNFYEDTGLKLTVCTPPVKGEACAYAYSWKLENEPENQNRTEQTAHFLIPEGADSAQIWILTDGSWKEAKTQTDGSYLTASIPSGSSFAVYGKTESKVIYYAAGIASVVILILLLVARAGRRKRKVKKTAATEK